MMQFWMRPRARLQPRTSSSRTGAPAPGTCVSVQCASFSYAAPLSGAAEEKIPAIVAGDECEVLITAGPLDIS